LEVALGSLPKQLPSEYTEYSIYNNNNR
jgi:hypothetical protein